MRNLGQCWRFFLPDLWGNFLAHVCGQKNLVCATYKITMVTPENKILQFHCGVEKEPPILNELLCSDLIRKDCVAKVSENDIAQIYLPNDYSEAGAGEQDSD